MQINIPSSPDQVTLKKFVDFKTAADDVERCMIASGKSRKQVMGLRPETITLILTSFAEVCDKTTGKLQHHIRVRAGIRRMRLSVIPALESMTLAEHCDLDELSGVIWNKGDWSKLPQLMGILYRPTTERLGKWYRVEKYDSAVTKHMPFVLNLTMDEVNAALLFFSTIGKELQQDLSASLVAQARKTADEVRKL